VFHSAKKNSTQTAAGGRGERKNDKTGIRRRRRIRNIRRKRKWSRI
jgi:hypothetical protein